jgi:hypothetical protein
MRVIDRAAEQELERYERRLRRLGAIDSVLGLLELPLTLLQLALAFLNLFV